MTGHTSLANAAHSSLISFRALQHCRFGSSCKYSHQETNLVKLLKVLKAAKQTVDVCVFNITCDDIANTLAALHKQGVRVRIVTDDEQVCGSLLSDS
jgi:phosphatidylserine/phosphatidylglycerophosphate/cardiolipin synthase-like enzyme